MKARIRLAGALGLALTLALAGCGSSSSSSGSTAASTSSGSSAATAAPAAASTPASTSTPAAAASTGLAKPGASFAAGQTANVGYVDSSSQSNTPQTTLQVTVKSIEKGTLADFKNVQLDATAKAGLPEYVQVQIVNTGHKAAAQDAIAADVQGIDNTGNTQSSLTIIGDFARCNDTSTQAPLKPGQTLSTCLIFMVPGGITKVAYTGTNDYIDSPVTWH